MLGYRSKGFLGPDTLTLTYKSQKPTYEKPNSGLFVRSSLQTAATKRCVMTIGSFQAFHKQSICKAHLQVKTYLGGGGHLFSVFV